MRVMLHTESCRLSRRVHVYGIKLLCWQLKIRTLDAGRAE